MTEGGHLTLVQDDSTVETKFDWNTLCHQRDSNTEGWGVHDQEDPHNKPRGYLLAKKKLKHATVLHTKMRTSLKTKYMYMYV